MGHLYSRIFRGTAFIAMFNGIGFLVPSAIAATGGLAQNYRGKDGDHYTSSLELALRMIQGENHMLIPTPRIDIIGSCSWDDHRTFQQCSGGLLLWHQEKRCLMGVLI